MSAEHPITPPPELRRIWAGNAQRMNPRNTVEWLEHVATQAARWGWKQRDASVPEELQKARDEELKACCEWLAQETPLPYIEALRAAMRPKPPSLAEEALKARDRMWNFCAEPADWELVRAALERLQELEKGNE